MFPVGFQTIDGRMSLHPTHIVFPQSSFRCVVFSVAGQALALPVEAVRRFLPLPRLDRLPTAPLPVEGVFRYHGEIVPVLRLGALLDLGAATAGLYAPLILITWQGRPAALLVDQVHGDVAVPVEERVPSDPSLSFNGCAVAAFPDRVTGRPGTVTLLDPGRLLSEAESRLLDAFRAAEERRLGQWNDGQPAGMAAGGEGVP
ncbi:chemotaxis protein CheW [Azospirillum picis]|uniref:Purine-binding chemotaxis protein CheW n=1 Tax=Azospirillum picis TaxID=488438 RepID=A0ABU0MHA6_9PROT|nr:chemotaxis protein CheW [Azospirillum picis]MBP2298934.1 purine-binding chemotaxis protein CheW [Azospirillum picis]MDQ0532824.1 purine-binding chemotaxis protein CheW [Azospirillum picis]